MRTIILSRAAGLIFLFATDAWCQGGLADASLEQLLNTKVTSVSKKEQKLERTAAAVTVISQDDIRRSGAMTLPDILRMVPGVQVAQIDANAWAISIRGFNNRYSRKLLVLVDGRSVYTPSFSGVYWDQLDLPLADIERIEVIRGPGATVWGANAMNGVINIITKSSAATQGGMVEVAAGSELQPVSTAQYGDRIGTIGTYRAFAKFSKFGDTALANGAPAADGWSRIHGGFRSDWELGVRDSASVQGDLFSNRTGQTRYQWFERVPGDQPFLERSAAAGGNLVAKWTHSSAGGSETSLQGYFDTYRRVDIGAIELMKSVNLDFQNRFTAGSRHDVVWGVGLRANETSVTSGVQVRLSPPSRTDRIYSAFIQDEIALFPNLWLTLGSKVEHNPYTGLEYEPSVRLAWMPVRQQTVWASASRAIRQPSREEIGIALDMVETPADANTVMAVWLYGNPNFQSEVLRDFEVGYRAQWSRRIAFDAAAFLSFYRHLSTFETPPPQVNAGSLPVRITVPMVFVNQGSATSYGGEASLSWSVNSRWRTGGGYAWFHIFPQSTSQSPYQMLEDEMADNPGQTFQIHSTVNLSRSVEWGQTLYWTAHTEGGGVPSHARLDSRLAWKLGERVELSIVGQNLLRPRFCEFLDTFQIVPTQLQRSVFGKITWSF